MILFTDTSFTTLSMDPRSLELIESLNVRDFVLLFHIVTGVGIKKKVLGLSYLYILNSLVSLSLMSTFMTGK